MEIGLVGLGKMGGNMRERLRACRPHRRRVRPQSRVSDTGSLEELVGGCPARGSSG